MGNEAILTSFPSLQTWRCRRPGNEAEATHLVCLSMWVGGQGSVEFCVHVCSLLLVAFRETGKLRKLWELGAMKK